MSQLDPPMYPSGGLLQAHFDAIGGGLLERTVGGDTSPLFAVVQGQQISIPSANGGGDVSWVRAVWNSSVKTRWNGFMSDLATSETLPTAANLLAASNSDINTWQLGTGALFDIGVDAFGAVNSVVVSGAGASAGANYAVGNIVPINGGNNNAYCTVTAVDALGGITAVGSIVGGGGYAAALNVTTKPIVNLVGETRITLAQAVANGTSVQVFYIYRGGSKTLAGQGLGGWPHLHLSETVRDWGTANDGDNYGASALYHMYRTYGIPACKDMADKIIDAQLASGLADQTYTFDLPLDAARASGGLYQYNNYSAWSWQVKSLPDGSGRVGLNVKAEVGSGGPPYPSAGWGSWVAYPISAVSPFNGFNFDFYGDGSGNRISLSVNIHDPADAAGEYGYGFACLTADKNLKRSFALTTADFWQLTNIVLSADRSNTYSGTYSNDGLATVANIEKDNVGASGFHRFLAKRFSFFLSTETYAGCYFGSNNAGFVSTGTTNLRMDLESSVAGNMTVTIKDANNALFTYTYAAVVGQQLFDVPYTSFTNGANIVHPIKQVDIQPNVTVDGTLDVDLIRCASVTSDIVNMSAASFTVLNGWQFDFDAGKYDVYWKNIKVDRPAVNPYPGLSRWEYQWAKFAGFFGSGSYRGPIAPGYQWMLGYTLSGKTYPAGTIALFADGSTIDYSGTPVINRIRQFMKDAQDAHTAQYPAATAGPFMKKYGVDSWEQIKGFGYIGGVAVPNATYPQGVLNQFYCEGTDDWYGYQYRAMLSVAQDYFASGDATSKAILDTVMTWIATVCTWNAVGSSVTVPTTFNVDGTLANGSNIYGDACLAQVCIYKYWRDGDATALTWYERFLADLHYNHKLTAIGTLAGIHPQRIGSGYTYANVVFTVNAGATAPTAKAIIAGGKVVRYEVLTAGANITSISATVSGDGSGAVPAPYLDDLLMGAYDKQHTGWEASEILNALSMLMTGRTWGTVNHAIASPPAWILQDYTDLVAFYDRNSGKSRPSMMTDLLVPLHEFTFSSWHGGVGVEDPRWRDTHTDGDSWTETIGPTMFAAVDRYLFDGNRRWSRYLLALLQSMGGEPITDLAFPVDAARIAEQAKFARDRVLLFRPKLNWCQNVFGQAPCTATGEACYQTYVSCKDKPNFTNGIRVRTFCNADMEVPLGEDMRPYVILGSFQPSPTEIPLIGGLARRSNIVLKLQDEVCSDHGEDPYISTRATPAGGTYLTRWLARNPYYHSREAEILHGYRTNPFSLELFQTELYQFFRVTGTDENDQLKIELTDISKSLDYTLVPAPTSGRLVADLKATEYNGPVASATSGTVVLSGDASPVDDYYKNMEVYISVGSGSGERRVITGYVGATRTATLATNWLVTPDTGSTAEVAALSLTLESGTGSQYLDPVVTGKEERVKIGGEEIRYTAIAGDVISWPDNTHRAVGGTTREDHAAKDGVQQCWVVADWKCGDAIQKLFNDGNMPDVYLDLISLMDIDDTWLGEFMRISRSISEPTKASELINQLLQVCGIYSWWDAVSMLQRFSADIPKINATVVSITQDNIVQNSARKESLDSLRITDFALFFNPQSSTGAADATNLLNADVVDDAAAVSDLEYGGHIMQKLYCMWLTNANSIYAQAFAERVVRRLRDVPTKLSFQLDPRDELGISDVVDVTHRKLVDLTGAPKVTRMRVVRVLSNGLQQVSAVSTSLSARDGIISPEVCADYPTDSTYCHITDASGLMPDGTDGFLIV